MRCDRLGSHLHRVVLRLAPPKCLSFFNANAACSQAKVRSSAGVQLAFRPNSAFCQVGMTQCLFAGAVACSMTARLAGCVRTVCGRACDQRYDNVMWSD